MPRDLRVSTVMAVTSWFFLIVVLIAGVNSSVRMLSDMFYIGQTWTGWIVLGATTLLAIASTLEIWLYFRDRGK